MGRMTPLGAVVRGALAGAIGTAAMDLAGYLGYLKDGGEKDLLTWEFGGIENWEQASMPGKVGKRLYEAWTQKPLGPQWADLSNNLVHWGFGTMQGAGYGVVAGSMEDPPLLLGLPFGFGVWIFGYVVLPLGGFYKPLWEYSPEVLGTDLWVHLVYGMGTSLGFKLLSGGERS